MGQQLQMFRYGHLFWKTQDKDKVGSTKNSLLFSLGLYLVVENHSFLISWLYGAHGIKCSRIPLEFSMAIEQLLYVRVVNKTEHLYWRDIS